MNDEDGDVVFELGEWGDEFRAAVTRLLDADDIPHEWEGTDLVVDEADADAVDGLLDRLEGTPLDEIVPVADTPPAENEASYDDLSALFVAADRLLHAPDDPDLVGDLDDAVAAVDGTSPPFGVGEREWTRVLAAATAVAATITDGADSDVVSGDARNLRDLLRPYV